MKILSLNLDHTNTNYGNCLKKTLLHAIKEDTDVIAFQEVVFGYYGGIKDDKYLKQLYNCEIPEKIRTKKPYGTILLTKDKFRDVDYFNDPISGDTTVYVFKDKVIAHTGLITSELVKKLIDMYQNKIIITIDSNNAQCLDVKLKNEKKSVDTSKHQAIIYFA